jgi:ribosomal protein S3
VKQVKIAVLNVLLKQGQIGIKVKILPPGVTFPDDVKIKEIKPSEEIVEGGTEKKLVEIKGEPEEDTEGGD